MDVNRDLHDLFRTLNGFRVRYLVVGAHAVAYHAEPRYTKDLDLWVEPSAENASRVWKALARFGAPLQGVTEADFSNLELVYQVGIEPNRVDVMMGIEGVRFGTAWRRRVRTTYGGVPVCVLGRSDLVRAKRAAGRPQDQLDVRLLTGRTPRPRRQTTRTRQRRSSRKRS